MFTSNERSDLAAESSSTGPPIPAVSYDEDMESFTITRHGDIVFYLRQLINDRERLNVMFDEGRESLLTMPLHLDEEEGVLILDWGGSEGVNRRLLKSTHATFIANPMGVRNLFHAGRVWETTYQTRPAFAADIPRQYVRLQRRENFRLTLPLAQRRPCTLAVGDDETAMEWQMIMVDIGLGGVGLESPEATLPFGSGQANSRALIDLGKSGRLTVDLEVRYVRSVTRGRKEMAWVGCRFVKLRPAQETTLQRFITQIQREERSRLG